MIEIWERVRIIGIRGRRMIEDGIFEPFKSLGCLNYRNAVHGIHV